VLCGQPMTEPVNLGPGWMGFDFASAFHVPVKVINDAAMQALGSYRGARCCSSDWAPASALP
jgi:polyphosphate glucokinase